MTQIKCPECDALIPNISNFCSMCGFHINRNDMKQSISENDVEILDDEEFVVSKMPNINEKTLSKLTEMSMVIKKNSLARNFEISKLEELYRNELEILTREMALKKQITTEKLNFEYQKYATYLRKIFLDILGIQNTEFVEILTKSMEKIVETNMLYKDKILNKKHWLDKDKTETIDLIEKTKRIFQNRVNKTVDSLKETITFENM